MWVVYHRWLWYRLWHGEEFVHYTGYHLQRVIYAQETPRYKWQFDVTELFNIAVSCFDAKKSARYSQVLVVTQLVLSRTQCMYTREKRLLQYIRLCVGILACELSGTYIFFCDLNGKTDFTFKIMRFLLYFI